MFKIFWDEIELKMVQCRKPFMPLFPLKNCVDCQGHNGIVIRDDLPMVLCGFGGQVKAVHLSP